MAKKTWDKNFDQQTLVVNVSAQNCNITCNHVACKQTWEKNPIRVINFINAVVRLVPFIPHS